MCSFPFQIFYRVLPSFLRSVRACVRAAAFASESKASAQKIASLQHALVCMAQRQEEDAAAAAELLSARQQESSGAAAAAEQAQELTRAHQRQLEAERAQLRERAARDLDEQKRMFAVVQEQMQGKRTHARRVPSFLSLGLSSLPKSLRFVLAYFFFLQHLFLLTNRVLLCLVGGAARRGRFVERGARRVRQAFSGERAPARAAGQVCL